MFVMFFQELQAIEFVKYLYCAIASLSLYPYPLKKPHSYPMLILQY